MLFIPSTDLTNRPQNGPQSTEILQRRDPQLAIPFYHHPGAEGEGQDSPQHHRFPTGDGLFDN